MSTTPPEPTPPPEPPAPPEPPPAPPAPPSPPGDDDKHARAAARHAKEAATWAEEKAALEEKLRKKVTPPAPKPVAQEVPPAKKKRGKSGALKAWFGADDD